MGNFSPAGKEPVSFGARLRSFRITKSWQYLLYFYLILPGILFLLAWILRNTFLGSPLGILYHNYNLFAICPVPNFQSYTGVVGFFMALWFLWQPLRRQDWPDLGLSLGLVAINAAFFLLETPDGVALNYLALRLLSLM